MKSRVFIASSVESLALASAIHQNLDFAAECTVWTQGVFEPSGYALDSLTTALDSCDFGVFVFSPEDTAVIRKAEYSVVRDNVIFELGLFIGGLGRKRAFIIQPRDVPLHLPTDILGFTTLKFEPNRSDGNIRAALTPACTEISGVIARLGGRVQRIEDIVSELNLQCIEIMKGSGEKPYFHFTVAPTGELRIALEKLQALKLLRFDFNANENLHAYHWTPLGKWSFRSMVTTSRRLRTL